MSITYIKTVYEMRSEQEYKVTVTYNKGDYRTRRGYYLTVQPVKREFKQGYHVESYSAYSGYRMPLLDVQRASASQEDKAIKIAMQEYSAIIDRIESDISAQRKTAHANA